MVVNDPTGELYYGGDVAAPLFSSVVSGALRLMNIPPDNYSALLVDSEQVVNSGAAGAKQ